MNDYALFWIAAMMDNHCVERQWIDNPFYRNYKKKIDETEITVILSTQCLCKLLHFSMWKETSLNCNFISILSHDMCWTDQT